MEMTRVVPEEMSRYFKHLAERVEKHLRAVPKEKVYVKPFTYGNSIGHLILHLPGTLNHFIGAGIAGPGYARNRPLEFSAPNPPPPDVALAKFRDAVAMVVRTIESQKPEDWGKPITENQPIQTRFGMFLVVI